MKSKQLSVGCEARCCNVQLYTFQLTHSNLFSLYRLIYPRPRPHPRPHPPNKPPSRPVSKYILIGIWITAHMQVLIQQRLLIGVAWLFKWKLQEPQNTDDVSVLGVFQYVQDFSLTTNKLTLKGKSQMSKPTSVGAALIVPDTEERC